MKYLINLIMDVNILKMIFYLCVILVLIPYSQCDNQTTSSDVLMNDNMASRKLNTIRKCCPPDQGLIRFNASAGEYLYDCADPIQDTRTYTFNVSLDIPVLPLQMFNPMSTVEYGFPSECGKTLFENPLLSATGVPDEYCVDKIIVDMVDFSEEPRDGPVVVLSCDPRKKFPQLSQAPTLRTVVKCCIGNKIYDTDNHTCIDNPSPGTKDIQLNEWLGMLKTYFDQEIALLDVKYWTSPCLSPSVALEYSGDLYDLKKVMDFGTGNSCIDISTKGSSIVRSCRPGCEGGPCVTKCCPEGQVFMHPNNSCPLRPACAANPNWGFTPTFYDISNKRRPIMVENPGTVGIRYTPHCPQGKYILKKKIPKDVSYLDVITGVLFVPALPDQMQSDYCLETVEAPCPKQPTDFYTFVCFPVQATPATKQKTKLKILSIGLIISCVFLAATLMIYLALPALQNLHGRTLMSHVFSMLVAYSCLARVQLSYVPENYCKILGFAVYFSFLAAFSWLNIMCFDIWWTFGNIRAVHGMRPNKDKKKYLLFSIYAWGAPLLLTTITLLLDEYDVANGVLDPNIGQSQCWFSSNLDKLPVLILFILPVGIQTGINLVLFVMTALHCSKIKSEIHRMQAGSMGDKCKRRFLADKAKYAMNMKLFIVMGITWVAEIISSFFNEPYELWYVADAINALQGVPIFILLVCKKKVYHLIRKRLGLEKNKRQMGESTTSTGISSSSCKEPLGRKFNHQISTSSQVSKLN